MGLSMTEAQLLKLQDAYKRAGDPKVRNDIQVQYRALHAKWMETR